ncbi:hypothetical protein FPOAC2_02223 [Fusarium poae]
MHQTRQSFSPIVRDLATLFKKFTWNTASCAILAQAHDVYDFGYNLVIKASLVFNTVFGQIMNHTTAKDLVPALAIDIFLNLDLNHWRHRERKVFMRNNHVISQCATGKVLRINFW